MKTTLSTIILEESIKASLFEFDIPKDDTKTNTTTPKPKNKVSAAKIADTIINSKGWFSDSTASLYNAIISIPDSKTFWEVNKIIQTREGKTFSGYLATILDDDEWEWWYPIIKYLTTIIPKTQWKTVIKNVLDKTTGIADLAKKNRVLASEITKELPQVGLSDSDSGSSFDMWALAMYGGLAFIICRKQAFRCWDRFKKLTFRNKQESGIEVANTLERILHAPLRQNKRALIKIMDYELKKGRLTSQEYNEMKSYLKGDDLWGSIPTQDINRAYFNSVIKSWQEWSTAKPIIPGEAKNIIEKVDDPKFTKLFGPKLQAIEDRILGKPKLQDIEDRILGKQKHTKTSNQTNLGKLVYRDVKGNGVSKIKTNFKKYDINRWLKIMSLTGHKFSISEPDILREINKFFDKTAADPVIAAEQAIVKWWNNHNPSSYPLATPNQQIYTNYPVAKYWLNWIKKSKTGISKYNYYDRLDKFPSYEQWVYDMKNAGSKSISEENYQNAYYLWVNSRMV